MTQPTKDDEVQAGAFVNHYQMLLMFRMFGIHAWTYHDHNPFKLAKDLEEQERASAAIGI